MISGSLDRRAKVFACGSSPGHPGSAQMRSVRMSTVVPSGTLISVGSRVRALVRLLADPPLLGTMGSVPRAHGGPDWR